MSDLGSTIVGLWACITVGAWVAIVVFSVRMAIHTRPGVRRVHRQLLWNPLNVVFRGDLLTEEGLADRRRMGWSFLIFVSSIIIAFVVSFIGKVIGGGA